MKKDLNWLHKEYLNLVMRRIPQLDKYGHALLAHELLNAVKNYMDEEPGGLPYHISKALDTEPELTDQQRTVVQKDAIKLFTIVFSQAIEDIKRGKAVE